MKFNFFYIIKFLVIFFGYVITGKLGLEIGAVSGFATLVWFPAGLSVAALFLLGYRLWPAVFLGAFLVNMLTGAPVPTALGISIGNTLEALAGAFLLKKMIIVNPTLERLRDVLGLLLAAPLIAAISAAIGVLSLSLSHIVVSDMLFFTWLSWWTGDLISILIVAPLLLTWITRPAIAIKSYWRIIEAAILILFLIGTTLFVFTNPVSITYVVFPSLIWAALRFGPRETIMAVFAVSLLAIFATSFGMGPFVRSSLSESLFYQQAFMGIAAVTFLILAAVVAQNKSLEKRKDEFVSMASHELRTPITSMKIYIHILMSRIKKMDDKKSLNVLENIDGQVDHLKELVSDLLDISLIQVKRMQFRMSEFIIADLINEVRDGCQATTKKHTFLYPDKAGFVVYGDKFRITQVLTNLFSNAIKYSPKGGDVIIRSIKKKNKIIVSVQDFGIGLSKEQKQKIFDRLYQASYHEERTFPGLGVGLYISKEIMKRHKEDLWVETELGKGSTFYFTLPVVGK